MVERLREFAVAEISRAPDKLRDRVGRSNFGPTSARLARAVRRLMAPGTLELKLDVISTIRGARGYTGLRSMGRQRCGQISVGGYKKLAFDGPERMNRIRRAFISDGLTRSCGRFARYVMFRNDPFPTELVVIKVI
jgi:hypothetical protein